MRKTIKVISLIVLSLFLGGCSSTSITEYDTNGNVVKVTEISGNPFVILAQNSATKSWAIRQGGWKFNIGYDTTTNSVGINGGSLDNMMISYTDSQFGVDIAKATPDIFAQTKYAITVNKDGVISKLSDEELKAIISK